MTDAQTYWIAGRLMNPEQNHTEWEFMGLFDSKEKAIAACTRQHDFYGGPITMNERLSDETVPWKDSGYPRFYDEAAQP